MCLMARALTATLVPSPFRPVQATRPVEQRRLRPLWWGIQVRKLDLFLFRINAVLPCNSFFLNGFTGVAEYTCYSSSTSSEKSSDTLSTGAAVGIAVGGTVLLLVGLFLIAYYGFGLFGGKKSGLNDPLIGNQQQKTERF